MAFDFKVKKYNNNIDLVNQYDQSYTYDESKNYYDIIEDKIIGIQELNNLTMELEEDNDLKFNIINQIGQDIEGEKAGDNSGYSVSLSNDGTKVAIGAPFNDGNGGIG